MPRPLEGRRILVTRPSSAGAELALMLEGLGAEARHLPVFEVVRLPPPAELATLLQATDALLVSSRKGLEALLAALPDLDRGLPVHCVGESTAAAARAEGFRIGLVGAQGGLEDLVARICKDLELAGLRLLWPSSALSEPAAAAPLVAAGARLEIVALYEPRATLDAETAAGLSGFDAFIFASPSAFQALAAASLAGVLETFKSTATAVAIGATTARALREAGWQDIRVAAKPDNEGLLAACLEHLTS